MRVHYNELRYEWEGSWSYQDERYTGTAYTTNPEDDPNGRIVEEIEYFNGWEKNYKSWYKNGQLEKERVFVRDGAFIRKWHENSQLAEEETIEAGFASKRRRWNEAGELIEDFVISENDPNYKWVARIRKIRESEQAEEEK